MPLYLLPHLPPPHGDPPLLKLQRVCAICMLLVHSAVPKMTLESHATIKKSIDLLQLLRLCQQKLRFDESLGVQSSTSKYLQVFDMSSGRSCRLLIKSVFVTQSVK
jgi:hypothetical protein